MKVEKDERSRVQKKNASSESEFESDPVPEPPQQPPHQEEIIDISSSSEDEHEPTPFIPLILKAKEEEQPPQPRQEEKNPSADEEQHLEVEGRPVQTQSVVKVIPIYPTQEVFDISSGSDDELEPTPIQVLISKAEVDHVSSPRVMRQIFSRKRFATIRQVHRIK
ncbi:hypothetical protein PIB30_067736 [Stylosanthes scabra]|uniref:Uncharacterized protein n=1 Tax=Stylosanthes scabra TaxID=79078 RepID=A0ABU6YK89_9FABA|nr:hypothetical protein [Stylosanthes scabra]